MEYRYLGNTGVQVNPLCLGTNFVDTAHVYSAGGSEEIVGMALTGRRDDVVLATADVTLDAEILDKIDELVPPGVTLNSDDNSYGAAELAADVRRR
jgi:predicted aldo/keto reductase-like oxidoreductase